MQLLSIMVSIIIVIVLIRFMGQAVILNSVLFSYLFPYSVHLFSAVLCSSSYTLVYS